MNRSVLVTGTSGFVGRRVLVLLLDAGYDVRAVVRLPIREDHPTEPLTAYGRSKVVCERYLQETSAVRGCVLTVLRLAQVYGPGERPIKAIPRFIEAIRAGRPPLIYGDGSDLRDYVYVDDAARAMVLALEREAGGVFNISSGQPRSILDVARILAQAVHERFHERDAMGPARGGHLFALRRGQG